jgi:hypothetical protein
VSLPPGHTAPEGGISIGVDTCVQDGPCAASAHVFIEAEQTSGMYSLTVPNDSSASWQVSYYRWGSLPYLKIGYYSSAGTQYQPEKSTFLPGGADYGNVDLILLATNTISGTISLPEGLTPPDEELTVDVRASNQSGYTFSSSLTIPAGGNSAGYALVVPDDNSTSWTVGFQCWTGNDLGFIVAGFYSTAGTQWRVNQADPLSGGESHSGIDLILLKGVAISGTVSLPGGQVAPAGGMELSILVSEPNGLDNPAGTRFVGLPEGEGSAAYSMTIPDEPGASWVVRYHQNYGPEDYLTEGYYSNAGTQVILARATLLNGGLPHDGIDMTLITTQDTDADGISDAWEIKYFGNITTADETTDHDRDGYSDLQEYLNGEKGETDPKGGQYDPKTANEPGGTGFVDYDTDDDGLFDAWEMTHFGNLTTADGTTDYDRDGYTDLQEYLNERNGVRDPLGAQHDPKTANAPEGQGYTNSDDDFWQLMIPVIINGALESATNQVR